MLKDLTIQDLAASIVAVSLTLGLILLSALAVDIPSEMSTSLGGAITWLFVRSTQQAERMAADTRYERHAA